MNKIKLILLSSVLISLILSQTNQEIIYLNNGSIIKGEIIEIKIDDTITVKSGNNIFNFNYSDVLKIEKNSKDTKSEDSDDGILSDKEKKRLLDRLNEEVQDTLNKSDEIKNKKKELDNYSNKLKAARAYLEKTRKKNNNQEKEIKKFYYMLSGGIAQEEHLNEIDYAGSFLGFYWKIKEKALLGFNQTFKMKHIGAFEYQDPDGACGDWWDCDVWFYRRLYGISYIDFQKKIGDGLYWRIDGGYTNWEYIDVTDFSSYYKNDGLGILVGVGYGFNNLLIEFDYHLHLITERMNPVSYMTGLSDNNDQDYISWWNFSIGKLFD